MTPAAASRTARSSGSSPVRVAAITSSRVSGSRPAARSRPRFGPAGGGVAGQQVLQQVPAHPVAFGQHVLLGRHVGLRRDRAAQLEHLHELRHGRQRDLAGHGVIAGRIEHALPQRELPDPERLEKIRKRDPLRHPPGGLLAGDREIRPLRRAPVGQPHQEGPEHRPDMPGDLIPQPVILTGPVRGACSQIASTAAATIPSRDASSAAAIRPAAGWETLSGFIDLRPMAPPAHRDYQQHTYTTQQHAR